MKQSQLKVYGDSQLVINQVLGSFEDKKPELHPYHGYALKLIGCLGNFTHQHVPKWKIRNVDALPTVASTLTLPNQTQVNIFQK